METVRNYSGLSLSTGAAKRACLQKIRSSRNLRAYERSTIAADTATDNLAAKKALWRVLRRSEAADLSSHNCKMKSAKRRSGLRSHVNFFTFALCTLH